MHSGYGHLTGHSRMLNGQGRFPGTYIVEEIQGSHADPAVGVQSQQLANEDVVAAMTWLRGQKVVDTNRVESRDAPSEAFRPFWLPKRDLVRVLSLLLDQRQNLGATWRDFGAVFDEVAEVRISLSRKWASPARLGSA
jgi:hypothetical protein